MNITSKPSHKQSNNNNRKNGNTRPRLQHSSKKNRGEGELDSETSLANKRKHQRNQKNQGKTLEKMMFLSSSTPPVNGQFELGQNLHENSNSPYVILINNDDSSDTQLQTRLKIEQEKNANQQPLEVYNRSTNMNKNSSFLLVALLLLILSSIQYLV